MPVAWALGAALLSWLLTGLFLVASRTRGWGKAVRRDGPAGHLAKEGTPTMAGVAFLAATLVSVILLAGMGHLDRPVQVPGRDAPLAEAGGAVLALVLLVLASGALGLWDDLTSLNRKRRASDRIDGATGVLARWRLAAQTGVALAFAVWAVTQGRTMFNLPWLDVLGFAFVVVGAINALNFTDGLDGLAAGTAAILLLAFWGDPFAVVLIGALLGFLWFNAHPAKAFMGGVGSEALGAALAGLAILHGDVWRLPLLAAVPVVEVLSVMAQVTYFRSSGGRRLLRMSPLHHHFELGGWPETRVVARFWLLSVAALLLAVITRAA